MISRWRRQDGLCEILPLSFAESDGLLMMLSGWFDESEKRLAPLRFRLSTAQRQRSASGSPLRGVTYSQDSHPAFVQRNCNSSVLNASTTDLNSAFEKSAHSV